MTVRFWLLGALLAVAALAQSMAQVVPPVRPVARGLLVGDGAFLQGLDKITARLRPIELGVGETIVFGTLRITLRSCRKAPPEEAPESIAFLEISEVRSQRGAVNLFNGWMFASSPALSALEHPVYDVWVTDCRNASKAPEGNSR